MTSKKQTENIPKALYLLTLIPVVMFGLIGSVIGFFSDTSSPLVGLLWGAGIGAALLVVCAIPMLGWEWIKKEAEKGKALPFMIVGVLAAIAISSYLALSLGNPTCVESTDTDNRGSTCIEYADDGYEATSTQKWNKFWSTLPVTLIITSLIAVIVRNEMEKNKKK